eukprot:PhM_4_TR5169/c3_g1_i1/m.79927
MVKKNSIFIAVSLALCFFAVVGLAMPNSTPLMLWDCVSDANDGTQLFQVNNADKTFRMANDTNMCIDISGYSTSSGASLYMFACHTDDKNPSHQNQEWNQKDDTYVSVMSQNCLGVSSGAKGAMLQLTDCSSGNAAWTMLPGSKPNTARFQLKGTNFCARAGAPFSGNPCQTDAFKSMIFCNVSKTLDERVNNVISLLSLQDKVNLLGYMAQYAFGAGISPYVWWGEALHGVAFSPSVTFSGALQNATSFAQVGLTGATFDADLFARIGKAVGREGRVFNNNNQAGLTFWTPNVNIFRDPRWGRGQETPGEDPLLTSTYAKSFVSAFQYSSEDPNRLVASACCKHYAAYSLESWGGVDRHSFNAIVTEQDFTDTYTPAFEACAHKDAGGASSFMCSYNAVSGVPSCANKYILTDLARTAWGFDGYITSDCGATDDVQYTHHYTNDTDSTCQVTLRAGMDLDCGSYLQSHVVQAYNDKAVNDADLAAALGNLFRTQFRLGMFDPDSAQPFKKFPNSDVNSAEHQALAREAATKGIVLLENRNQTLPLKTSAVKTVAVIGPNADNAATLQGNYNGQAPFLITPRMGIADHATVKYAKGSELTGSDMSGFGDACQAAHGADAVVVVIGLDGTLENEGHDRTDIAVPDIQRALVDNVTFCAAGKPVIVVVMAGGSVDLTPMRDNGLVNAMLWVGYPGQAGGQALADILFGAAAPSGRMPYTVYQADYVNQVSMFDMGMRPNTTTGNPGRTYRFFTGTPVYPFGHGLSYSTFTYTAKQSQMDVSAKNIASDLSRLPRHTTVGASKVATVTFHISNTGSVDTDHVVLCYAAGPMAGQQGRPIKTLVGFQRIKLSAGAATDVSFDLSSISLSVVDDNGQYGVESGAWRVFVEDAVTMVNIQ